MQRGAPCARHVVVTRLVNLEHRPAIGCVSFFEWRPHAPLAHFTLAAAVHAATTGLVTWPSSTHRVCPPLRYLRARRRELLGHAQTSAARATVAMYLAGARL